MPTDCTVVRGDMDYVAAPDLIRTHYACPWPVWEALARQALEAAARAPRPFASLYARCAGLPEAELLARLAALANEFPQVQVLLHFFDPAAAEGALAVHRGRLLLNHVSGESWMEAPLHTLLARHRPRLVVQPVDDGGIPADPSRRLAIVERLHTLCAAHGLAREDLFVDALSPAAGTAPHAPEASARTVALAVRAGFSTIAWPGNAGLGHPQRQAVAAAYAGALVRAGLHLAVIDSRDTEVIAAVQAAERGTSHDEASPPCPAAAA